MNQSASPADPVLIPPSIEAIEADHIIQRLLCDDLERIADRLPDLPTLPELRRISDRILSVTNAHLPRAEQVFRSLPADQCPTQRALDALHKMHVLDEVHGEDLVAALWQHVGAAAGANVGQLSYMLRCFFDGCRRAITLKESYLDWAMRKPVRQG